MRYIYLLLVLILFIHCSDNKEFEINENQISLNKKYYTQTIKNITTTFSNDINLMDNVLDLYRFKADSIKFKEVFIDNSGGEDRLAVPGPSDYYLNGIVYYSPEEMKKINAEYVIVDWVDFNFQITKNDFLFDWFDENVKSQIIKSDFKKCINHDIFLSKNRKCILYILNDKIIFKTSSI